MDRSLITAVVEVLKNFANDSDGTIATLNVGHHRLREATDWTTPQPQPGSPEPPPQLADMFYPVLCAIHSVQAAQPDLSKFISVDQHQAALLDVKNKAAVTISDGLADFKKDEQKVRQLEQQVRDLQSFAQSVRQFEELRKAIADQAGRLA